jgi:DNA helicase-2/ATP-dependent DNA helicase PcrA
MPVETFSKEEFEGALPVHKETNEPLWTALGLKSGEYAYLVPVNGGRVAAEVRSSVKKNGVSAEAGEDSIRCWLVDTQTGKPIGSNVSRWTTRQPGWETRLKDILRTLWQWRMRAGDCPKCDEPKGIWKVKKEGSKKGRPFAKCRQCDDGFVWLDEEPKREVYFVSHDNSISGADETSTSHINIQSRDEESSSVPSREEEGNSSSPFKLASKATCAFDDEDEDEDNTTESFPAREPNEQQHEAITAPVDFAVRVLAPPGSGKTFVLSHRYAHLLENGVEPKDILAVTFSKSMADELLERIKRVSPQIKGTEAERQVCTIHAICFRMLRDCGDRRQVPKEWQLKKTLDEISEKLWPFAEDRPGWKETYHWINVAKFCGLPTSDDLRFFIDRLGDHHGRSVHEARRLFDQRMADQGFITYSDMLFDVEQKLKREAPFRIKWQKRFKWVITDEGQDVNSQAMRVLSTLAQPQNQFFIVADDAQLLYRFAGATPEANVFEGFEERYSDGMTVMLAVNYRSTSSIIGSCQRLIAHNYEDNGGPYDQRYLKGVEPRPDAPEGNAVSFQEFDDAHAEATGLVESITEQIASGLVPGDIFVCARTRAQLGYVEGPLVRAKIPFINICGGSFWGSRHVGNVIAYLRLAHDNSDNDAFKRVYNIASNWNVRPWGTGKGEYCNHRYLGRAFMEACGGKYKNVWNAVSRKRSWEPGVRDLTDFMQELEGVMAAAKSPAEVVRSIIDDCYCKYMVADEGITVSDDAENGKTEDLETVVEVANQFSTVEEFLDYVDEALKAAEAAKNKSWDDYVVLSTVHGLKGLERDTVFVLGCSEGLDGEHGLLPHTFSLVEPRKQGVLPTGGKGRIEDERCIMFVAVSRAQNQCFLSGVREYREAPMGMSRFVQEMGLSNPTNKELVQ